MRLSISLETANAGVVALVEKAATAIGLCDGVSFQFKVDAQFSLAVALPEIVIAAPAPAPPPLVLVLPNSDMLDAESADQALLALRGIELGPLVALAHSEDGN